MSDARAVAAMHHPLAIVLALASATSLGCAAEPPLPLPPPTSSDPTAPAAAAPASSPPPDTSDDAAIAKAEQDYVALVLDLSPETGTALGDHARDADLDTYTRDGEEADLKREEAMLSDLRVRFPSPRASLAARTDLALVESALAVDVRVRRTLKPLERSPEAYTDPMAAIFMQASHEYAPAPERARAALARIEKLPAVVALARTNLGAPPRVWVTVGIEQAKSAREFFADQRTFLTGALPQDTPRIDAAVAAATQAYAGYARFLEHDVMPRATDDFAAGRELFGFLLREGYFLEARRRRPRRARPARLRRDTSRDGRRREAHRPRRQKLARGHPPPQGQAPHGG